MEQNKMKLRKLLLAATLMAGVAAAPTQASIIDNPRFQVLGLVIVWGGDGSDPAAAPVVSDFVIGAAGGIDLITEDGTAVVTGTLSPVGLSANGDITVGGQTSTFTDANSDGIVDAGEYSSLTPFNLDATSDVDIDGLTTQTSFYVASNTGFTITTDVAAGPEMSGDFDLDSATFSMGVVPTGEVTPGGLVFGGAAVNANFLDGATFPENGNTLGDIDGQDVFVGVERTAGSVGTILEQSVRFDNTYTLGGAAGYDLSQGAGTFDAVVTYTIGTP